MGTPFSKIGGNPIVLGLDGLKDEVKAGLNTPNEFPSLSAGSATGVTGDVETASWMARQTNADGAALIESVKGNTLRWNQLAPSIESASWHAAQNTTISRDGGKITATVTEAGYGYRVGIVNAINTVKGVKGHKYLVSYYVLCDKAANFGCDALNGGSRVLSACTAGVRSRIAGIFDYPTSEALNPNVNIYLCSMTSMSVGDTFTIDTPQLFDLTAMFGAGNEPATVAEFEALFPEPYYPYDPGSLLPVRMTGIETVGFNQWDEEWEVGGYDNTTGAKASRTDRIRSKNPTAVFPGTFYFFRCATSFDLYYYDGDGGFISHEYVSPSTSIPGAAFTTPSNAALVNFHAQPAYGTTYQNDICINLSDPARNGTYEPYWSAQRAIAASTYFPDGMRSAGTVRDELTADEAITRVGAVDLGTLTWTASGNNIFVAGVTTMVTASTIYKRLDGLKCSKYPVDTVPNIDANMTDKTIKHAAKQIYVRDSAYTDAAAFKAAMSGVMLHYALATPTTTPIDPPIPMSYRTGAGGIERVMVAEGSMSAPPIFATRYPLDPADLAASIAPVDGPTATTNHQVGDLLMLGFTLCKATQVIVTGETIAIGTNVTRTTVAAELAALSE